MPGLRHRTAFVFCIVGTLAGFLASPPARGDNEQIFRTRDLLVVGRESDEPTVRYLQQVYAEVTSHLAHALGWTPTSHPTVVLVADRERFQLMSGSPYVSAFAVPSEHVMVISLPAVSSLSYVFQETFEHELCHLTLHDHISSVPIPRWLDEGVCQWVTGSLGELLIGRAEFGAGSVDLAFHAVPLSRIADRFPMEKRALFLAYEQSRSFIDFLSGHYGREALLELLDRMKAGRSVDAATREVFGKPLPVLEEDWLKHIRRASVWLAWGSRYLYEILFFLAAVLSVAASFRLRRKWRDYEEESEDEPPEDRSMEE